MLARIAAFELRYQLFSPLFLIGFGMFFLLTFGSVASSAIQIGAQGNVNVNSPFAILQTVSVMNLFALFIVTAFVANVVIRDQETGFAPMVFATPVRKSAYLIGRFVGAVLVAFLVMASVPLAILIGSMMPWLDQEKVGSLVLTHYLYALFLVQLPVLLVSSAGLFALATATRSMMWTYVGVIAFLVLYFTERILLRDPAYDTITSLLDPFGIGALFISTKYWTAAERNSLLPPVQGLLLENRLIWLGVAALVFVVTYVRFSFAARGVSLGKSPESAEGGVRRTPLRPPQPGSGRAWAAFGTLTRFEMRNVWKSPAFFVLLFLGALNTLANLVGTVVANDVAYFPVTRTVVEALQGGFTLFPLIIAIYYSGELVWRERERRMHEIVDATPAPAWTILLPKMLATALVLCATMVVGVLLGMLFQLFNGYSRLEPLHYLLWFLMPETIGLWLLTVLTVCIQSLVPHKAIGWAVMVLYIVLTVTLNNLGYEQVLYHFGDGPPVPLSDMNGMGRFWIGRAWGEVYWSAFATMLGVLCVLLYRRGTETRLAPRLALAWRNLRGAPAALLAGAAALWLGTGAFIYYNTNIVNDYLSHTTQGQERDQASYEKALLQYESVPQPKVISVKLDVQLYPREVRADTTGSYVIENRTGVPLSVLHVAWRRPLKMQELDLGPATLEKEYKEFDYRIYRLATPMAPGEQRTLRFKTRLEERGFPNGQPLTRIVENGTFLNNEEITPWLGMTREGLLKDRSRRRRNGLMADLRPPKLEDTRANAFNYGLHDSDWVNAEISVTTDADQTPLAPGYTVSDEVKNGRRTLVTRTEAPILQFFSIQSARYAIAKDVWTGKDGQKVDLAVYYYPLHDYNIQRILTAMKASLDVFAERFGPYQFRQARILEFPAYERFAQSFANTIPFSEAIGFVQNFDERKADRSIDLVTFVTAHELGHQWWAHQVIGADKQGDTMLSESFAQYSALLVMEKLYGHEQIRKFLKNELDEYLRNRGAEAVEELPLDRVEDQPYIHYRKGAVVMYWLKEIVGEPAVDGALRKLLAAYAFKPAPYPSTTDFLAMLRQEAPGHEQEIADLFERITLYDLKAHDATAHKRADGRYDVRFVVEGKKLYADGKGKEKEVPLAEPVDVGAFTAEPGKKGYQRESVLKLERVTVKSGKQTLTLVVDKLPKLVRIDPFNERIDRNSDDNLTSVKLE
jgi:aminopeptidase N